ENVKRQTSAKKGYREIAGPNTGVSGFNQFIASFPFSLVMPEGASQSEGNGASLVSSPQMTDQRLPVVLHTITPLATMEQVMDVLVMGKHGVSEKIDGERCVVWYDGGDTLLAFNRSGTLVTPPPAAQALKKVGYPLIIDGERVTFKYAGQHAGLYV